jgi:hypothetical protein
MCLIIVILLVAVFLFLYFNKKEDYSFLGWSSGGSADTISCGSGYQYPPWPTSGDCGAWIDYLSSGYPTIALRGNQAFQMVTTDPGWAKVCSPQQFDILASNSYAFNDALNPGVELDVATVVGALSGVGLSKKELCGVAKVITAPPSNLCQKSDWSNNYMSTMTPAIQATLNKWASYC